MFWMMIAFLASLAALLAVAAGVARHIWLQRTRMHGNPDAGPVPRPATGAAFDPVEEADLEIDR